MIETKENICHIEGILSEIDIKKGSFMKNGSPMESIGGIIKVKVTQPINGVDTELEVPVHMFAAKMTNKGTPNPAYESIERVMNEYVSIAAAGSYEKADAIRISRGQITMNEYYNNGVLVSFPRITATFVNKIARADCKQEATFSVVFAVGQAGYKVDKDGVEDKNTYTITGIVPKFGGKVDVVPFVANNPGVINAITSYWNQGDTVKASGRLNFTSRTETKTVEVDFGEPREESRTISVSELIITGGSQDPFEGDFALNHTDIEQALAVRSAALEELKNKKPTNSAGSSGSAPSGGKGFANLGF